jgi:hypothetical protein
MGGECSPSFLRWQLALYKLHQNILHPNIKSKKLL